MVYLKRLFFIGILFGPLLIFGQCLEGDCNNGYGKYKFKNGIYTGEFSNKKLSGEGIFTTNNKSYSYNGSWRDGLKSGFGRVTAKRGLMLNLTYEGDFFQNIQHGYGKSTFQNTKHMQNIVYSGEVRNGVPCGKGELTYDREVKYGRENVVEKNNLIGLFVNGVYQGRMTVFYGDELVWKSVDPLKTSDFQKYQNLTERDRKRFKNPATIEGGFVVGCECKKGVLIFDVDAVLRKSLSWWSTKDIPTKTKSIILNTRQREFDIIEWHARDLEGQLNKKKLICSYSSLNFIWDQISLIERECLEARRVYTAETAWNPKKGLKNKKIQEKWNNRISKKLDYHKKNNKKILSKLKKSLPEETISENHFGCVTLGTDSLYNSRPELSPIFPEPKKKKEVIVEKEKKESRIRTYVSTITEGWSEGWALQSKEKKEVKSKEEIKPKNTTKESKSFKPQFHRRNHLE